MSILKHLLRVEIHQITKDTPYVKVLKIASVFLATLEVFILTAWVFNVFSLIELVQISFFLFVLALVMPLVLRLRDTVLLKSLLIIVVLLCLVVTLQPICDAYYIKRVLGAYLEGKDYSKKWTEFQWAVSSCARSYTAFFIGENDFLKRIVEDKKDAYKLSQTEQEERVDNLRATVIEQLNGLDDRFREACYSNEITVAELKNIRRNYEKVLSFLDEKLTSP